MSLFLITFFLLYGGMHIYAFLRARAALSFTPAVGLLVAGFMAFMVLAPVFIRQSEKHGFDRAAQLLSWTGYLWLGVLFLFVSVAVSTDLYRLCVRAAEVVAGRDLPELRLSASAAFWIPLTASLIIGGYGYFEALNVRLETITVRTSKLPEGVERLRIAQISDVHLGLIVRQDRLRNIFRLVKEAGPDVLVSTGDLVDGQINGLPGLAEMFRELEPKLGKYAITGNHEYYAGLRQALAFTEKAGFRILRGEAVSAGDAITIAGIDDPAGRQMGLAQMVAEKDLLAGLPRNRFTLFLKHRPLVDSASLGLFDLQLSGHVHRGQIFPFSILTKLYYPVHAGFSSLDKGSLLYVSRGTGTWGPPIRFLSPPEVTIIDLVRG